MLAVFLFCTATFLVLFTAILAKRVSLEFARHELESLKAEILDRNNLAGRPLDPLINSGGPMQYLEYLAAAYAVIWAAILVYFIGLARRERDIWTELHALKESIAHRETTDQPDA